MPIQKIYTKESYKNKLIAQERILIIKALKRTKGSIRKSHHLLCPRGLYYSYQALIKVIERHNLKPSEFKN